MDSKRRLLRQSLRFCVSLGIRHEAHSCICLVLRAHWPNSWKQRQMYRKNTTRFFMVKNGRACYYLLEIFCDREVAGS